MPLGTCVVCVKYLMTSVIIVVTSSKDEIVDEFLCSALGVLQHLHDGQGRVELVGRKVQPLSRRSRAYQYFVTHNMPLTLHIPVLELRRQLHLVGVLQPAHHFLLRACFKLTFLKRLLVKKASLEKQ